MKPLNNGKVAALARWERFWDLVLMSMTGIHDECLFGGLPEHLFLNIRPERGSVGIHGSLNHDPPQCLPPLMAFNWGKRVWLLYHEDLSELSRLQDLLNMGDHRVERLVAQETIGGSRSGCLDIWVSEQLSHTLVYHEYAVSQASLNNQVER